VEKEHAIKNEIIMLSSLLLIIIAIFATVAIELLYHYEYSVIYKDIIGLIALMAIGLFLVLPLLCGWIASYFVVNYLLKKKKQNSKNINNALLFILDMGAFIIGDFLGWILALVVIIFLVSLADPSISGINLVDGAKHIIDIVKDIQNGKL